jgi:hypothetical protein
VARIDPIVMQLTWRSLSICRRSAGARIDAQVFAAAEPRVIGGPPAPDVIDERAPGGPGIGRHEGRVLDDESARARADHFRLRIERERETERHEYEQG